jgi:hypothetical protein
MEEKEELFFDYTHFEKVIIWKRNTYCIKANSKEDADKVMINMFNEGELGSHLEDRNDELLTPWWCDDGDYYDGDEWGITYEENRNSPTEELYDESNDLLEDNTPLEVRRNNKIDYLLNGVNL